MGTLKQIYKSKTKTSFDIQYIIINKRSEHSIFHPPLEFDRQVLKTICFLPQNLLQLSDPLQYIVLQWKSLINAGYDVSFLYEDYPLKEILNFPKKLVTVLFIDKDIKDKLKIISAYESNGFLFFFHDEVKHKNSFSTPLELIDMILESKEVFQHHFKKFGLDINLPDNNEIPEIFKQENKFSFFLPSHGNFFMLNQYIGNIYFDKQFNKEIKELLYNSPEDKIQESFNFKDRAEILMKQIKTIDKFRIALSDDLPFLKKMGDVHSHYTPLILVSPYQYPQLRVVAPNLFHNKILSEALKTEQDLNYMNSYLSDNKDAKDVAKILLATKIFNTKRLGYLDEVAYLHASLTFSPTLRLPLLGKSLNKVLSFLQPKGTIPKVNKLFRLIKSFGKDYSKRVLSDTNANIIFSKNRQIVAISDLPVEWMQVDDHPLCVHMILPEFQSNHTVAYCPTI